MISTRTLLYELRYYDVDGYHYRDAYIVTRKLAWNKWQAGIKQNFDGVTWYEVFGSSGKKAAEALSPSVTVIGSVSEFRVEVQLDEGE